MPSMRVSIKKCISHLSSILDWDFHRIFPEINHPFWGPYLNCPATSAAAAAAFSNPPDLGSKGMRSPPVEIRTMSKWKKNRHFTHGKVGFTMIYPWKSGIYHDLPMEKWDLP